MMHEIMRLRKQFSDKGILICFNGPFSQSIIEEIGIAVRKCLESGGEGKEVVMDVFAVYIEQAQNITNYLARKGLPVENHSAIMTIARKDDRYVLSFGNTIEKGDAAQLVERIEKLNSLDRAGLKNLYREQLRRETPRNCRGAGLGLIDMARRASGKLAYRVDGVDDTLDFFILTVTI